MSTSLSPLVIEGVVDAGERIQVWVRTPQGMVVYPAVVPKVNPRLHQS
jgi:hypothetical protein